LSKFLEWKKAAASLLGLGVWCDDVPLFMLAIGVAWKFAALGCLWLWESDKRAYLDKD